MLRSVSQNCLKALYLGALLDFYIAFAKKSYVALLVLYTATLRIKTQIYSYISRMTQSEKNLGTLCSKYCPYPWIIWKLGYYWANNIGNDIPCLFSWAPLKGIHPKPRVLRYVGFWKIVAWKASVNWFLEFSKSSSEIFRYHF